MYYPSFQILEFDPSTAIYLLSMLLYLIVGGLFLYWTYATYNRVRKLEVAVEEIRRKLESKPG